MATTKKTEQDTLDLTGMTIQEKLMHIQCELSAPKNSYNSFGKYYYRSTENIFEGVKPLLEKYGVNLTMNDKVEFVEGRFYIVSEATLTDVKTTQYISKIGFAREDEAKKGMDGAQVTGATISYARKYALGALFILDDSEDNDSDAYEELKEEVKKNEATSADDPETKRKMKVLSDELMGICQKNKLDKVKTCKWLKLNGKSSVDDVNAAIDTLNQWITTGQDLSALKEG